MNQNKCPHCGAGTLHSIEHTRNTPSSNDPGTFMFILHPETVAPHESRDEYDDILSVKLSVGGYSGGFYHADFDIQYRTVRWSFSRGDCTETGNLPLCDRESKVIKARLRRTNLLLWDRCYIEPQIPEGTLWRVEVHMPEHTVRKYGDSRYPPQWNEFCELVAERTSPLFSDCKTAGRQ